MEMLTFCVQMTYFHLGFDMFEQKDYMLIGSPLSLVMVNLYMEYFQEMALRMMSSRQSFDWDR